VAIVVSGRKRRCCQWVDVAGHEVVEHASLPFSLSNAQLTIPALPSSPQLARFSQTSSSNKIICACAVFVKPVRSNTAIDMKASEVYIHTLRSRPINKTWWGSLLSTRASLTRETAWCGPESTERGQSRRGTGRWYRVYAWAR
jgi:hypothetical protein